MRKETHKFRLWHLRQTTGLDSSKIFNGMKGKVPSELFEIKRAKEMWQGTAMGDPWLDYEWKGKIGKKNISRELENFKACLFNAHNLSILNAYTWLQYYAHVRQCPCSEETAFWGEIPRCLPCAFQQFTRRKGAVCKICVGGHTEKKQKWIWQK